MAVRGRSAYEGSALNPRFAPTRSNATRWASYMFGGAAGRACSRCRRWFAACCRLLAHYWLKEGLIMGPYYDVIVLWSGLSACEAAHAAARLGSRTLLIAQNLSRLADISLNARMGGPVRGILVREVDALGGLSGRAADAALLHIRLLNETRGPAHWALR